MAALLEYLKALHHSLKNFRGAPHILLHRSWSPPCPPPPPNFLRSPWSTNKPVCLPRDWGSAQAKSQRQSFKSFVPHCTFELFEFVSQVDTHTCTHAHIQLTHTHKHACTHTKARSQDFSEGGSTLMEQVITGAGVWGCSLQMLRAFKHINCCNWPQNKSMNWCLQWAYLCALLNRLK